MQRVHFSATQYQQFFPAVVKAAGNWRAAARRCRVHQRTFRDWARGIYRPPLRIVQRLSIAYRVRLPSNLVVIDDTDSKRAAARLGALARIARYGNPGTPDGRRRGGMRAMMRMRASGNTRFLQRKPIIRPRRAPALAEFIGVMLGDGGTTRFQITIATNSVTDVAYAKYLSVQCERLFGIRATVKNHEKHTTTITASSAALVEYLRSLGVPLGDKIRQRVDIPTWILRNPAYLRACIRGLMDTDGCTYLDTHRYRNRVYRHMCIGFTSASPPLLRSVLRAFRGWNLHPTQNSRKHMLLRREVEVVRYFAEIGTSNPKHRGRFERFRAIRQRTKSAI
ncbi:hypothetical protein HY634_04555 [Candidatus Uhrbacteria bacterium]|nr:hypothetical protein [Candidatus Uhrbacteria bacterium]